MVYCILELVTLKMDECDRLAPFGFDEAQAVKEWRREYYGLPMEEDPGLMTSKA